MRKIKALSSVVVILLIAPVMLAIPLTASGMEIIGTPRYCPTSDDLDLQLECEEGAVMYTEEDLKLASKTWGGNIVYGEMIIFSKTDILGDNIMVTTVASVMVFELSNANEAKKVYDITYARTKENISMPDPMDIGEEGFFISDSDGKLIFFRTGRFFVNVVETAHSEGIAEITEQKIEIAAATPTPTTAIPAFQIIPAIVALLTVAYLLRRRK